MTLRHNYSISFVLLLVIILAAFASGCATANNKKFGMTFLPSTPKNVAVAEHLAEAPQVESNLYISHTPSFVNPTLRVPPRPSAADMRVRRADELFLAGRRLYERGEKDEARKKFDASLDALLSAPEDLPDRTKIEKKLEELTASIFRYDVNGLGLADLSQQPGYDRAPLEDILDLTFPVDSTLTPVVKEQVQATVSQLPLQVNDTVLSYIRYFQTERGRRTLLAGFKRAGRYRNLITKTLAEEGVPQELIYLAQAESGFLPRAVSRAAATGMWQFMQGRGREYGLYQSAMADDRLDPEKATRSAARHLKDLYEQFGDWYLAIAGYNCGPGCVEKAVQRTGYADFWELRSRNAIPRETSNYVPIILAMTIMAKNPSAYGLDAIEIDPPLEYETVKLDASTHLALIADVVDRPVSEIRELNPALLRNIAPAGYELKIPTGMGEPLLSELKVVPEGRRTSWRMHRVSSGDTLASIARQYRVSVDALTSANNGDDSVVLGKMLVVPAAVERERTTVQAKASKQSSRGKSRVARHSGKSATVVRAGTRGASGSRTASRTTRTAHKKVGIQSASLR